MMRSTLLPLALVALSLSCSSVCPPGGAASRDVPGEISERRLRDDIYALAAFHTRHTLSDRTSTTRGIGAAQRHLRARFDEISRLSGGRLAVEEQTFTTTERTERMPAGTTLVNVLATLPGSAPEGERKVIIVSGHYDSRAADVMDATIEAPGANDDASGVAVVLECARLLSATGAPKLRHTVVFAAVSGEEQGLTGAAALAARAKAEGWPLIAMITNDIVGNSVGGSGLVGRDRVRVFSEGVPTAETPLQIQTRQSLGGESDGPSRQLARYVKEQAERAQPDFEVTHTFRRDRYGRGGDHIPFLRQGYAAIRITEPHENFRRQHADITPLPDGRREGDLPEYVDYAYLARVARVNLAALTALASAPPAPSGASIDTSLSYDTSLTWEAVPGAAGYAVLARDTTAAVWTRRIDVGPATRATLKDYSKDDWQFAVEAYDAQGRRSIPAVPSPRRAR